MPGTLYVVATPLGHLEDMTLRAIRILGEVSLVACEDTRRTATLLRAHGVKTPTTSYFEHNERFKGVRILEALRSGRDVALVSDAGTPGISDPGYRLVRDARAEGIAGRPGPRGERGDGRAVGVRAADRSFPVRGLPAGESGGAAQRARGARRGDADARVLRVSRARRRVAFGHAGGARATATPSSVAKRPRLTRSTCARRSRRSTSGSRRATASRARSCSWWPERPRPRRRARTRSRSTGGWPRKAAPGGRP